MDESPRSGKTTAMMETAVELLGTLPQGANIYITGAHYRWLDDLRREFKHSGLVDVMFFTPRQILNGALRGRKGVLLIDDFYDLPFNDALAILEEKIMLERGWR